VRRRAWRSISGAPRCAAYVRPAYRLDDPRRRTAGGRSSNAAPFTSKTSPPCARPEFPQDRPRDRRSILVTPLVREGVPLGAILSAESNDRRLRTTDRAPENLCRPGVIAIENVRLFQELAGREPASWPDGRAELQGPRARSGGAVSSHARPRVYGAGDDRLGDQSSCRAATAAPSYDIRRGTTRPFCSWRHPEPRTRELVELLRSTFTARARPLGRMALTREPGQIADICQDATYQSRVREIVLRTGYARAGQCPSSRERHAIGGLVSTARRRVSSRRTSSQLLRTFRRPVRAGLQNARLFQGVEGEEPATSRSPTGTSPRVPPPACRTAPHDLNAVIGFSEVLLERMFRRDHAQQDEYLQEHPLLGRHLLS